MPYRDLRNLSYPPADHFVGSVGPAHLEQALRARADAASAEGGDRPLALLVNVPAAASPARVPGNANASGIARVSRRTDDWLDGLARESSLASCALGGRAPVCSLRVAGRGGPVSLARPELDTLMITLRRDFRLEPGAGLAIELDTDIASPDRLVHLRELGFDGLVLRVSSPEAAEDAAADGLFRFESLRTRVLCARAVGFTRIEIELVHGMPGQALEAFTRGVSQVAGLRPDRVTLRPWPAPALPPKPAPEPPDDVRRQARLAAALAVLTARGYVAFGLSRFVLRGDPLAAAWRAGRLQGDGDGLHADPGRDLVALGVGAEGHVGATFYQNERTTAGWLDALSRGQLPVACGLLSTRDDDVRRAVIADLQWRGQLDFTAIGHAHGLDVRGYFADELARMARLRHEGLVTFVPDGLVVTPAGRWATATIARVFDRRFRDAQRRERFTQVP